MNHEAAEALISGSAADDSPSEQEADTSPPYFVLFDAAWPQAIVVACRNAVGLTDIAVLGRLGTDERPTVVVCCDP
jgi:hypothetical protein